MYTTRYVMYMLGMAIGGDYLFTWVNFVGLNISMVGSLVYTKVTLAKREEDTPKLPMKLKTSRLVINA